MLPTPLVLVFLYLSISSYELNAYTHDARFFIAARAWLLLMITLNYAVSLWHVMFAPHNEWTLPISTAPSASATTSQSKP